MWSSTTAVRSSSWIVEGESLAALLRRGALPAERVVAFGHQIADALAAAHAGGIVHRDLKPGEHSRTPDGSIKILDFGIATALASVATTRGTAATVAETCGGRAGTPAYMAPEQLLGQPVDARSDLFSLAAILFEMATGRRLFASNEPLAVLLAAVRTLPRADATDARVPWQLADVIAKGLATDPAYRFQSAGQFKAALDVVRDTLFSTDAGKATVHTVAVNRRARLVRALAIATMAPVIIVGTWPPQLRCVQQHPGSQWVLRDRAGAAARRLGCTIAGRTVRIRRHRGCCRLDGAVRGATADAVTGDRANGPSCGHPVPFGIGKAVPR